MLVFRPAIVCDYLTMFRTTCSLIVGFGMALPFGLVTPGFGDGMAFVFLSIGKDDRAVDILRRDPSPNAKLFLEEIRRPGSVGIDEVDLHDPELYGYLHYLRKAGERRELRFFGRVAQRVEADNPNRDLGEHLGFVRWAHFSPRGRYLLFGCSEFEGGEMSDQAVVIECSSGDTVGRFRCREDERIQGDLYLCLNAEETRMLMVGTAGDEGESRIVVMAGFPAGKSIWERNFEKTDRIDFSPDRSEVMVCRKSEAGAELVSLDPANGKELRRRKTAYPSATTVLDPLPPEVVIPEKLARVIHYDCRRKALVAPGGLEDSHHQELAALSDNESYLRALGDLRRADLFEDSLSRETAHQAGGLSRLFNHDLRSPNGRYAFWAHDLGPAKLSEPSTEKIIRRFRFASDVE